MDIFLVRHGQAAHKWWQSADPGLSELGRSQADEVAATLGGGLAGQNGVDILSSPMQRARETAEPLAQALSLPVVVDDAFIEIRSPGPLSGRQEWLKTFMHQRWHEQPEDLQRWRRGAFERLSGLRATTVVFTHFVVVNAVVGLIQGDDRTLCCWPATGSITRLRLNGGNLELISLGEQIESPVL